MRGKAFWAGIAALAAGLIFVTGGGAATTATVTLTVNSTADSTTPCTIVSGTSTGTCSLRGAILAANAYQQDNTMFVIKLAAATYHLSMGTLVVNAASPHTGNLVEIVGKAKTTGKKKHKKTRPASVVDGSGNAAPSSVFEVESPTQMSNLVVQGGTGNGIDTACDKHSNVPTAGCGGGIFLTSALDMQNSIVQHNTACSQWAAGLCVGFYEYGGGIYLPGTQAALLTLYKTTVTHNTAAYGGGIGYAHEQGCNGNCDHTTVLLLSSHIDNNTACDTFSNGVCIGTGAGGGIYDNGETFTLEQSTVNGNHAGSLGYGEGAGGGVFNRDDTIQLRHTVVSGNTAGRYGGGIYSSNSVSLVDSIVALNMAGAYGGGIDEEWLLTSVGSALLGNTAGGTFACTIGVSTTCQGTTKPVTGTCATLYPTATHCSSYDGFGGGLNSDYEYPQLVASLVANNTAVSITGDATDCGVYNGGGGGVNGHGGQGGGVWTSWAMTAIAGTQITGNTADCGGGIYNSQYNATQIYTFALSDSTIAGNHALLDGGGLWTYGAGTGTLYGMTISGNTAGRQTGGVWDNELGSVILGVGNKLTKNTSKGACKNLTFPCQ